MMDIEIVKQLMNGNHLEPKELDRAEVIINSFVINLKDRGRKVILKILDSLDKKELDEISTKALDLWVEIL